MQPYLAKHRYLSLKKTLEKLRRLRIEHIEDPIEMDNRCENISTDIEDIHRALVSEISDYISSISNSLNQLGSKLPSSLGGLKQTIINMATSVYSCGYEEDISSSLAMDIDNYSHPGGSSPLVATKEDILEAKRRSFEEGYDAALTVIKKTTPILRKLDLE